MKEKTYRRLCLEDRKVIYNMRQDGISQIKIAQAIGFSQATISKELTRNKGQRGYRNIQAQRFSDTRQSKKPARPKVVTGSVKEQIDARLLLKHSPDQISKTLELEGVSVSHEAIYRYILADKKDGGDLWRELRINGKRRYRRRCKVGRGQKIPERVDIDERPAVVATRKRYGDWEADLIQGGQGVATCYPYMSVKVDWASFTSCLARTVWRQPKGSSKSSSGIKSKASPTIMGWSFQNILW